MSHKEKSKYSGKKVLIKEDAISLGGTTLEIIDWLDRVKDDILQEEHILTMYKIRKEVSEDIEIPNDEEVLVGKMVENDFGRDQKYLIHINEIEKIVEDNNTEKNE